MIEVYNKYWCKYALVKENFLGNIFGSCHRKPFVKHMIPAMHNWSKAKTRHKKLSCNKLLPSQFKYEQITVIYNAMSLL